MPPSTSIRRVAGDRREARDLVRRALDERLAAPAGVDRHAEDDVGAGRAARRAPRPGVPGLIAIPARQPSSRIAVRVRLACGRRLLVEGDRVGAGLGEGLDVALGRLDHQVDVDRAAGVVDAVGDRGGDQRADRDRRDEVAVHHVEVDHPGAGVHHLVDLGAEPREVGREDRGRDPRRAPAARPSARSYGPQHRVAAVWQVMSSVVLIRAIVWCSPQLGHCETSSKRRRQYTQRKRPGKLGRAQPGLAAAGALGALAASLSLRSVSLIAPQSSLLRRQMKKPVVRSRSGRSCRQRRSRGEASSGRERAEVVDGRAPGLPARRSASSSAATRSSLSRREIVQVA